MKTLLITLLFSVSSYASYSKPKLIARYSGIDAYNAPNGLYCFGSEPMPSAQGVFLGCQLNNASVMMRWNPTPQVVATSPSSLFSHPKDVEGQVSWYEFNEAGVSSLFEYSGATRKIDLKNLGPAFALVDSFVPIKNRSYIYRIEDESKQLRSWKNHTVSPLYTEDVSHIFPPTPSVEGNFVTKVRRENLNESAPDELLLWDGSFKSLLKDRDMDATSSIKAFRHQYAIDGKSVALIVTDSQGEALMILNGAKKSVVARAGRELKSFDYFSPKMRNGILLFRGVDFESRKALYIYENGSVRKLLTQGDTVMTDKGLARVDYQDQDALFYGAPGIGPKGEIYQQATLTDADSPMTLLGIGLIKFEKE